MKERLFLSIFILFMAVNILLSEDNTTDLNEDSIMTDNTIDKTIVKQSKVLIFLGNNEILNNQKIDVGTISDIENQNIVKLKIKNGGNNELKIDSILLTNNNNFKVNNDSYSTAIKEENETVLNINLNPKEKGNYESKIVILTNDLENPAMTINISFYYDDTKAKGLKVVEEIKKVTVTRDIKKLEEYKTSKRWAIVVGVNNYQDQFISDLEKAQNDAKVLSDILRNEGQFDYVFTFTDDTFKESDSYPSLNNLITKMEYLKNEIKPQDTLFFSFSGHGISDDTNRSYLLLADSKIAEPYKTSLPIYQIQDWIEELNVSKNIVILDACRNVVEKTKGMNTKTLVDEKNAQAEVSAVVYSTSPGEYSYEHNKEPYGVFTTYLVNGLRGNADDNKDMMITFDELRKYVEGGVNFWAIENNKKQKPYSSIKGEFHGDVVLSVIPLKERAKYNPYSLENSYQKKMILHNSLWYSSIAGLGVGGLGTTIGIIVGVVGYAQYNSLDFSSKRDDFKTYWQMKDAGFWVAIAFGCITLGAVIPFGTSFAFKPKKDKEKITLNIGYQNDNLVSYFRIQLE